jgi:hypothetical protein
MTPCEFLEELVYPATSASTVIALTTFVVLIRLAEWAGMLGLWLMVLTIPAILRYLTMIAEARAEGRDTAPPGIEYFTLVGNAWTLFPVIPVLLVAGLVGATGDAFGGAAATVLWLGFALVFPALIGVLVITHSPLQSLDPRAMIHFARGCGPSYWYAPVAAILFVAVPMLLEFLPPTAVDLVEVYLIVAFFAVTGAIARGTTLFSEIDLPDAHFADEEKLRRGLARQRARVLDHAYGFVSRGNRDGGLEHIYRWLARDPDPDEAWPWCLEQMLRWADPYPGMLLAQQYLGRLLEMGDQIAAVKLILRCRLADETFRPLGADLSRAIAAAEACNNPELVEILSRRR